MTYNELKNDPNIKWTEIPVIGLSLLILNGSINDSYGDEVQGDLEYWIGKRSDGYIIIFPAKNMVEMCFNDKLRGDGRLN